jgi:hypothetical protein
MLYVGACHPQNQMRHQAIVRLHVSTQVSNLDGPVSVFRAASSLWPVAPTWGKGHMAFPEALRQSVHAPEGMNSCCAPSCWPQL